VTKKPQRPQSKSDRAKKAGKWLLIVGLVCSLLGVAAFAIAYAVTDVPDPNEDFQTQTSFVYYEDGKTELGRYATQNRESIPLDEMPNTIKDAVVAAENKSFWSDRGIDPKGILRAAFSNAQGNATQGASTITQQYVKILYLTQEQTLERKVKEAMLSLKLHQQLSKTQILEGYLNTIYFGRGAYGVQAAAKAFFDKRAPCWRPCSTTRPSTTRRTASRPARISRPATTTSSRAWPTPAPSPPARPTAPSASCPRSRRSRPRASSAASGATCSRWCTTS
jgi:membrane peptidoglycan carboxypeptidase